MKKFIKIRALEKDLNEKEEDLLDKMKLILGNYRLQHPRYTIGYETKKSVLNLSTLKFENIQVKRMRRGKARIYPGDNKKGRELRVRWSLFLKEHNYPAAQFKEEYPSIYEIFQDIWLDQLIFNRKTKKAVESYNKLLPILDQLAGALNLLYQLIREMLYELVFEINEKPWKPVLEFFLDPKNPERLIQLREAEYILGRFWEDQSEQKIADDEFDEDHAENN